MSPNLESLLILGDSHSVIWEGNNVLKRAPLSRFNNVHVHHLGAALAFNLLEGPEDELGKWGREIFSIVEKNINENPKCITAIMLCFGEIDIRTQVIKRAANSKQTIESAVNDIVHRLNRFSEKLFNSFNIPVILWEPVATSGIKAFIYNPDFPAIGTETERNMATVRFARISRSLAEISREKGISIYSFGIAEQLMSFYETKADFFEDGCHLNLKGLEVAVTSLNALCTENQLPPIHKLFEDFQVISNIAKLRNIAHLAKVTLSSTHSLPSVLSRTAHGWCFHTDIESEPHAIIDIGYASLVRQLIVFNRFDSCKERAAPLLIFAGLSTDNLRGLIKVEHTWGNEDIPLVVQIPAEFGPIRFILLKLATTEYLHLGEVQILEDSYLI